MAMAPPSPSAYFHRVVTEMSTSGLLRRQANTPAPELASYSAVTGHPYQGVLHLSQQPVWVLWDLLLAGERRRRDGVPGRSLAVGVGLFYFWFFAGMALWSAHVWATFGWLLQTTPQLPCIGSRWLVSRFGGRGVLLSANLYPGTDAFPNTRTPHREYAVTGFSTSQPPSSPRRRSRRGACGSN